MARLSISCSPTEARAHRMDLRGFPPNYWAKRLTGTTTGTAASQGRSGYPWTYKKAPGLAYTDALGSPSRW